MALRKMSELTAKPRRPEPQWTATDRSYRVEGYDFYGLGRARHGVRELDTPAAVIPFCKGL